MARLNFDFATTGAKRTAGDMKQVRGELNKLAPANTANVKSMQTLGKEFGSLASRATGLNPALLGLGGGVAAIGLGVAAASAAIGVGIGHIVSLGDELTTLSSKTDLSTDFLQKLSHAATVLDVPFETAAQAASKLQINIGKITPTKDTLDSLSRLGLEIDQLKGLDAEQQFLAVGDAIQAMGTSAEQAAVAQALFGRGGIELLPLLRDNYRATLEEAEALGLVLSRDLLDAGDELGESWETLKTVGVSLLSEAVGPLVGTLNELAVATLDNKSEIGEWVDAYVKANPIFLANKLLLEGWAKALGLASEETDNGKKSLEQLTALGLAPAQLALDGLANAMEGTAAARVADFVAAKEQKKEIAELAKFVGLSVKEFVEMDDAFQSAAASAQAYAEAVEPTTESVVDLHKALNIFEGSNVLKDLSDSTRGWSESLEEAEARFAAMTGGNFGKSVIEPLTIETKSAEDAQREYNDALAAAADLTQIIGGNLGRLVGQTLAAGSALQNLSSLGGEGGILGGLGASFKSGKGDATGLLGVLGGIGGLAGAAGPLIGIGTTLVKGLVSALEGGPNLVRDAARDMGATISQELADSIEQSGRPLQLAVADLFQAGAFESLDRFAQETGDILSGLEGGAFGKPEAIRALEEAVPLLLQNLEELGPAGEAELQRIISPAAPMTVAVQAIPHELMNGRMEVTF